MRPGMPACRCARHVRSPRARLAAALSYCFSGYVGHYVLLLSYDAQRDGFLVHDPARQTVDGTFVASLDLHVARHSHGTDEDLIVVPFQQSASLLPRLHPDASAASPAA